MKTCLLIINNETYVLDVDAALQADLLHKKVEFSIGDVFVVPSEPNINPVVVVETAYRKRYQLLGMGLGCNSNPFYQQEHSREDIDLWLMKGKWKKVGNIQHEVAGLVHKFEILK